MRRPEFIARQGRHPAGLLGRVIARVMEHETSDVNDRAIAMLQPVSGERLLDVGTGHGRSLQALAQRTPGGLVVGADHSAVMCSIARCRNARLIEAGQVRVEQASSDALPFQGSTFDAAMAVHTLYFWDPLEPHLRSLAHVLRPGGRLLLVYRPSDAPEAAGFPSTVYRFRTTSAVEACLRACGFEAIESSRSPQTGSTTFTRAVRNG